MIRFFIVLFSVFILTGQAAYAEIGMIAQRVLDSETIRCGYAISPPALVKDPTTGEMSGPVPEVMEEIGKTLGLTIKWTEEAGWGNFIEGLRANRYDAFCAGMWPDGPRMKFLSLTQPFVYNVMYGYVRVDDNRFDGNIEAANSEDITVPVVEGDITETLFKQVFPKAKQLNLGQISTVSEMILSVTTKKADITLLAPDMFDAFDKTNPGELRVVKNTGPLGYKGASFGVKAGEYHMRDMLDQALNILRDDGTLEKIFAKYSEHYIPPVQGYTVK